MSKYVPVPSSEVEVLTGDRFECRGDVRGHCGHRHLSYGAAVNCRQDDRDGCNFQGGYSDRQIWVCAEIDGVEHEREVPAGHWPGDPHVVLEQLIYDEDLARTNHAEWLSTLE